ncbi:MAG TPA: hypothetical protein GX700_12520 [Paracoccus sp.]|nr:hypothetical protein [Paracoccus sp. (in: a-proteobacteria)]
MGERYSVWVWVWVWAALAALFIGLFLVQPRRALVEEAVAEVGDVRI